MGRSACAGPAGQRVRGGLAVLVALGVVSTSKLGLADEPTATPQGPVLAFNPATVGVSAGSAQQLTASFTLNSGTFVPSASLHYGLHYSAGSVTCTATGASSETCSVPVTFTPGLPGGRKDAILLMDGATPLGTMLLYGIGQSPQALIQPGVVTQAITGNSQYLYHSTVDENGTVYVVENEASSDQVVSVTSGGTVTSLPITTDAPNDIAVDGAGTLYLSQNTYDHTLVTYSASGVQGTLTVDPPSPYSPCSNSNGGTLEYLYTVGVDGLGDVFTNELLCTQIFELQPSGNYVTTTIAPPITQPSAIAIDSAGNVFLGGYTINELTTGGVQTEINGVGTESGNLNAEGLAVDSAETLYATRYATTGGVAQLAASNYATSFAALDTTASPLGLSLAPDGTLWVGNYTSLDRVDRSQGVIAFGEQTAGTASGAQTVSLYNGGNQALTLSTIAITGEGFAVQAASENNCTGGTVIQPGTLCQVAVVLTPPHAGTYSGTLSLTSNSLNTTTVQHVALSGYVYGVYVTAAPNPLDFGGIALDAGAVTLPVTLTNNGDLYAAGIGTPSSDSAAFTVTLGTCTTGVTVDAGCQLDVTFTPTELQAYSGTVTLLASSAGGGPNQTVTFGLLGAGGEESVPDAASEASAGEIEASTDASVDATVADASPADATAPPAEAGGDATVASAGMDAAASAPEDAGAASPDGATGSGDGSASPPAPSNNSCSCHAVGGSNSASGVSALGLIAAAVLRRRKQRRLL